MFPAFIMQRTLRKRILGERFWEKLSQRRLKISRGKYVSMDEFLELHMNKHLQDVVIHNNKAHMYDEFQDAVNHTGTAHHRIHPDEAVPKKKKPKEEKNHEISDAIIYDKPEDYTGLDLTVGLSTRAMEDYVMSSYHHKDNVAREKPHQKHKHGGQKHDLEAVSEKDEGNHNAAPHHSVRHPAHREKYEGPEVRHGHYSHHVTSFDK